MYTSYVLLVYLIKCPCKLYNVTMKGKHFHTDMDTEDMMTKENLTKTIEQGSLNGNLLCNIIFDDSIFHKIGVLGNMNYVCTNFMR